MNQYIVIILAAVVVLALLGMNQTAMIYGNPSANGLFQFTSEGNGNYKATLTAISDNGRESAFYCTNVGDTSVNLFSQISGGSLTIAGYALPVDPMLPNINVDNLQIIDNSMVIDDQYAFAFKKPYLTKSYDSAGNLYYGMGATRNIPTGAAVCGPGIPARFKGSVTFHDNSYVPPIDNTTQLPVIAPAQPKNIAEVIIAWIVSGWNIIMAFFGMGGA